MMAAGVSILLRRSTKYHACITMYIKLGRYNMTITVEVLLPWLSLLAAIASVITVFAKLRTQVEQSLEKDREQDNVINSRASKDDLAKVEKRLDALVTRVNEHGEALASLKSTIDQLRQSVDKLADKIDNLRI
jgi:septal ring factor EnvC (AmiA/AmiB activator)